MTKEDKMIYPLLDRYNLKKKKRVCSQKAGTI